MNKPSVSVVIPCYNGAEFIRDTLFSVVSQTYPVLEVLVIDDGSTDESANIADSYGSPVRVIRQPNQGESVARNRGLDEAKGDWIAFLDVDDLWNEEKLQKQIAFSEIHPEVKCIHTAWKRFGYEESIPTFPRIAAVNKLAVTDVLNGTTPPHLSTLLVHSSITHRFPEWTTRGEDLLYLADVSRETSFGFINEILAGYRVHDKQQTGNANHLIGHFESRIAWTQKHTELKEGEKRIIIVDIYHSALETLKLFYWKRQWSYYHQLRDYLVTVNEFRELRSPELDKKIYHPFVYSVVDAYRSIFADRKVKQGY